MPKPFTRHCRCLCEQQAEPWRTWIDVDALWPIPPFRRLCARDLRQRIDGRSSWISSTSAPPPPRAGRSAGDKMRQPPRTDSHQREERGGPSTRFRVCRRRRCHGPLTWLRGALPSIASSAAGGDTDRSCGVPSRRLRGTPLCPGSGGSGPGKVEARRVAGLLRESDSGSEARRRAGEQTPPPGAYLVTRLLERSPEPRGRR